MSDVRIINAVLIEDKYMAVTAPYGYRKDDNNRLVIDGVTAIATKTLYSPCSKQ